MFLTTYLAPNVIKGPTIASDVKMNSKIFREYIASNLHATCPWTRFFLGFERSDSKLHPDMQTSHKYVGLHYMVYYYYSHNKDAMSLFKIL